MQKYHPTRVITLTYQPFVLATTAIFTYHEAKVNTRLRNLAGYTLFFLSSFAAIIVSTTDCFHMFLFFRLRKQVPYLAFSLIVSHTFQLDVGTSGRGGIAPFVGICIIAAVFGIADGHVQGGMTGDLSLMCPEFIQVTLWKNIFLGKIQETYFDSWLPVYLIGWFVLSFSVLLCWTSCIRSNNLCIEVCNKSSVREFSRWTPQRSEYVRKTMDKYTSEPVDMYLI